MMSVGRQWKQISYLWKSKNKKKIFSALSTLQQQYGWKGVYVAVCNKLNQRPLLSNIIQSEENYPNYNDIGKNIFEDQQKELTSLQQKELIDLFALQPLISIIMPLYNAPVKWLERAIFSLQTQSYTNWELCAVDDGSKDGRGISIVKSMQKNDARIRLHCIPSNHGISATSNQSLAMATGDYIALIDQDDEITKDAFFWFVKAINENPKLDFIYSDECKIGTIAKPELQDFYFKPDWSPELLINHMYTGHLSIYRTELVRQIGGFRSKYDFAQDYDLALRLTNLTQNIAHIERILYFWRMLPTSGAAGGKDYARTSNVNALYDWYCRNGMHALMEKGEVANYASLVMETYPKVSIIIPTDSIEMLSHCIQGLIMDTSYRNLEIIPVTNSKVASDIFEEYQYLDNLRICRYDKLYNFSEKCNEGVKVATGKIIVIYNDDVYPYSKDWLERQVEVLQYPNVGAVSPMLLYEDRTIQYAGMITGVPGLVGTSFNKHSFLIGEANAFNHFLLRDVSVLSGACLVMQKALYEKIGGFDAINTPTGHSDMDLSFRILEQGYRCVYTPYAVLTHIGNHSWEMKDRPEKADIFCLKHWGARISQDPYFTQSMKKMFYHEFTYDYCIFSPKNIVIPNHKNSKDILFISHELTWTGAPILMMDMVKICLKCGDFPVVICTTDGPLKQDYLGIGVTVIIDASIVGITNEMFERFARNFDLIIVNTLVLAPVIERLENTLPPVLWWVHDGIEVIQAYKHTFPRILHPNVKIYCASEYSQRFLLQLKPRYHSEILRCGVADFSSKNQQYYDFDIKKKRLFLLIGSLEERKGQDVLLRAIEKLPKNYLDLAHFMIIGKVLQPEIKAMVDSYAHRFPCITYYDVMPREKILALYPQSICSIIPSRDEPTSMIGIESMMFSRTIISSDMVGIGEFVTNDENGFIFENENTEQLSEIIMHVIDYPKETIEMGINARQIYEKYYQMEGFIEDYTRIVSEMIEEKL